jgi:hypothetical protein
MLRPFPAQLMQAYPVSKKVNSPKNDTPDIIEPAAEQIEARPVAEGKRAPTQRKPRRGTRWG